MWNGPNPVSAVERRKVPRRVYFTLREEELPLVLSKVPPAWRDLFTVDVRVEGGPAHPDRDAFVDFVRKGLWNVETAHHGHMPIIEVTGDSTARGTWSMSDDLLFPAGHPWAGALPRRCGYGHYDEEYRKEDGEWKIASMRLTRLAVWDEAEPGARRTEETSR